MGIRWDITSRRHGLLPSGVLPGGHGRRVVTTVGVVATSVFGASACGTEPRVDEVRVSVTTPVLGGHRLSDVTDTEEAIGSGRAPDDVMDNDSVDSDSAHVDSPHIASAGTTIGGQDPMDWWVVISRDDPIDESTGPESSVLVTGSAATVMINPTGGTAGNAAGEIPALKPDGGGVGADAHDAMAGLAMTPEASGANPGGDALSPDSSQPDASTAHGTTHGDDVVHVTDAQTMAEAQGLATGDTAMTGTANDPSVDDASVNDAWVSEAMVGDADIPASDRAAIDTAVHRMWSSHVAARRAPTDTTTMVAALAAVSGQAQRWVRHDIESLAAVSQFAMADPFVPGAFVVRTVQSVDADRVVATICNIDTDQVWTVAAMVDGDPLVVRAGAIRSVLRLGAIRAGDIWMVDDVVVDHTEMLGIDAVMATGCR